MKQIATVFSLLISLLLVTVGTTVAAAPPSQTAVHFVVIGDRTGEHVAGVYEQAVAEIERLRPDFAITVGDQIEGYTTDTVVLNQEWDEYLSLVRPLTMPLIITPGNHDITYDAAQYVFESRVAAPYRSFDVGGMHFIIMDNSRWETSAFLPPAQMEWLENDLASHSSALKTFVFMHKPFWFNSTAMGKPDTLHTLFKKYGVDAVFTGHFHQYFSATYDGILYTGVGSSGASMDANDPSGLGYHFAWVTISSDSVEITPVKLGAASPWNILTADELHSAQKVASSAISFAEPLAVSEDLTIPQSPLTVTVHNLVKETSVRDTVEWNVPAGWSISPSAQPLSVPADGGVDFKVKIQASGNLYPLPTVSLNLPFRNGRSMRVTSTLRVARQVRCARTSGGITVDGKLNEASWQKPVTRFFTADGKPTAIESTSVYFTYDAGNLYIAAKCQESKLDSLKASITNRDGAIFSEDCIGFYLQPDIKKDTAYQIYFSAIGTVVDSRLTRTAEGYYDGTRSWNGTYTVSSSKEPGYWVIEAQIPLAQFGVTPASGVQMGINFLRKQQRLHDASDWQAIDYDPDSYGRLIFQ